MKNSMKATMISLITLSYSTVFAAELSLQRLDCGLMEIADLSYFSDTYEYDGQSGEAVNGCYLIKHTRSGVDQYLLWDMGLGKELLGKPHDDGDGWVSRLDRSIADQLSTLGLAPADITYVAISHFHGDHIGQAADFSGSTLLMGQKDIDYLNSRPAGNAKTRLQTWFGDGAPRVGFTADHDVFGDGSVVILSLPGHTPGHAGLLVKLKNTGPVLLSGDLYHFHSELGKKIVSRWNHSRPETLASQHRFESIIQVLKPLVVIQHDRESVDQVPLIPKELN